MRMRWIAVAAAIVLLTCATAMAQPAPLAGPHPGGARVLAAYLQLTPEQIASWKQINADTAAAVKPLIANARDLEKQLNAAVQAASPDPAAVGKLALSVHSARNQIRAAHEESRSKLVALLTPEQKVRFEAFQAAVEFVRHRPGPAPGGAAGN
jgi:Spy/CpxP family protein refolding chaperone